MVDQLKHFAASMKKLDHDDYYDFLSPDQRQLDVSQANTKIDTDPPADCNAAPPGRSYMDRPRIAFSGLFRSDVSSVNNNPLHFDTKNFKLVDQLIYNPAYASWNPTGTASFLFRDVTITEACPLVGVCNTIDGVVGEALDTGVSRVTAKMVNLDPENQLVSTLFGLRFAIRSYDAYQGPTLVAGDFKPAAFSGIFHNRGCEGYACLSASYQSIIENVEWNLDNANSPTLQNLKEISGNTLSIKFDVRHYHPSESDPFYTYGYVSGTIGPASLGEPHNFVRGRLLRGSELNAVNLIPFVIRQADEKIHTLLADVGNAFGRSDDDTGYNNAYLGDAVCIATVKKANESDPSKTVGVIDLTVPVCKTNIMEFVLPEGVSEDDDFQLLKCNQRGIIPKGALQLMNEIDVLVRPMTQFVRRMDPGSTLDYNFFAVRRGKPLCSYKIVFKAVWTPRENPVGKKETVVKALKLNDNIGITEVYTDEKGLAKLLLTAIPAGPGNPRKFIDGEVYTVIYCPPEGREPNYGGIASTLSLHLYDKLECKSEDATWWGSDEKGTCSVYAILRQYSDLYPTMRRIVCLGDYYSVVNNANSIRHTLLRDIDDPGHMPTIRDLSTAKRNMIANWLETNDKKSGERPYYDVPGVCNALQLAIQVEHSTIPLYLYAYFSIKPGQNRQVAHIIRSVLLEEMRHVVLSSNVLNSIDQCRNLSTPITPDLRGKSFIPVYPSPMPGGLRPELTLRLSRLSIGLIRDVFMEVEKPGIPLSEMSEDHDHKNHNTIGSFYRWIKKSLQKLVDSSAITFSGAHQVTDAPGGPVKPVTTLDLAFDAIHEIVEQGEGCSPTGPTDNDEKEVAHYYRFAEIVYGKKLVKGPNGKWDYTGDAVVFDPNGVYPVMDNARVSDFKKGTRARLFAEGFARSYLDLLNQLHETFNGHPHTAKNSFSTMMALTGKARELVANRVSEAAEEVVHAGVPFENPLNLFLDQ
ncbi:uncharacterized protein [Oscarella lobularis]